jgi:hypothetical protein
MVTLMSEQSGRSEPADRPGSREPRGADRSGSGRPQQPGRRQPGGDVLTEVQRWLIRAGARNMRSQFEDQVRRTFSGQRPDKSDVWDIATTEIPPEVGEAPECQWCPICRAARRMRDSNSGLAGQLSGAGEAAASAVQDAFRAFDTFLSRAAGGSAPGSAPGRSPDSGRGEAGDRPDASRIEPDADLTHPADPGGAGAAGPPDSLAGEHGPVGWKPGDRLATAGAAVPDPWAMATAPGEPAESATSGGGTADAGTSDAGTNGSGSSGSSASGGPDGRGHGPSDRG